MKTIGKILDFMSDNCLVIVGTCVCFGLLCTIQDIENKVSKL